jgi:uncharacterized membrane protein
MGGFVFLLPLYLFVLGLVVVGPILGIIGFAIARQNRRRIEELEYKLAMMAHGTASAPAQLVENAQPGAERVVASASAAAAAANQTPPEPQPVVAPAPETPAAEAPTQAPVESITHIPAITPPATAEQPAATIATPPPPPRESTLAPNLPPQPSLVEMMLGTKPLKWVGTMSAPPTPGPAPQPASLEMTLGTKWLNWIGALFVLGGVAYGLKYAYDNQWIGPKGRLAIGTAAGIFCLLAGERFRRRAWNVLFQTLTGLGLAIYYVCVFFSFQVYQLTSQGPSFALAVGVTGLAIALGVAHNAKPIAILAVIGGFLSPVLISTGENHPYALFSYIALLNLVALGVAYFKRWRELDLLCFAGTALLYAAWYQKFYDGTTQMTPAVLYLSIFYIMFLLIPTLHTLVHGLPENRDSIALVVLNAAFSLAYYYRMFYHLDQRLLGFIVVAQALMVFLVFALWKRNVSINTNTARSLLVIALGLVTVAVPLHLKMYGIPIAWALEGALLAYVGRRFRYWIPCGMGTLATLLATVELLRRLPMHSAYFLPVFNVPFGSWMLVAAGAFAAAWFLARNTELSDPFLAGLPVVAFLAGFGVLCLGLSLETSAYWRFVSASTSRGIHEASSLIVLWSIIAVVVAAALHQLDQIKMPLALLLGGCYVVGVLLFLVGLDRYNNDSPWPFFNSLYLPRLAYPVALFVGAVLARRRGNWEFGNTLEAAMHALLAVFAARELGRWGDHCQLVSHRSAFSIISAFWALHACGLIWVGLMTRMRMRRVLGFVLFAVTVVKVLLVDTSELEPVYRIVSFAGTGVLLLVAGYVYQHYSAMLLKSEESTGVVQ